jgi:hypothetical protein
MFRDGIYIEFWLSIKMQARLRRSCGKWNAAGRLLTAGRE